MKRLNLLSILLALILASCNKLSYEENDSGISLKRGKMHYQVEVLSDEIIRVVKSEDAQYKAPVDNICINKSPENISWDIISENGEITISTSKVNLHISPDATFSFFDKQGNALLKEMAETASLNTDTTTNNTYQAFHCGNEGLYGLGQYQNGLMNWKNTPLQLRQYNQEIAIPFLVSTNGYGLLWNNLSITDFNHPEQELDFTTVLEEKKNIRSTLFTPTVSGQYYFYVESPNPEKNRRDGPVYLTVNDDDVLLYNTVWVPDCHTGKIKLEGGKQYQVVLRNSNSQVPGRVFVNGADFNKTTFASKKGEAIDYYFVYGENPKEVMSGYRDLTGKAPMFPKWAYGFWQCRERYHNQEELLTSAREYRKRNIPLDNIVQDWHYWQEGTKGPSWNRKKFPNPKAMNDELTAMNLQLMASVWPEAKDTALLTRYGLQDHRLTHHRNERDIYNLDFYNSKVAKGYAAVLRDSMYNMGVDAIWLDGTEPQDPPHDWTPTAAGRWDEVTNAYSLMVNKSVYEGKIEAFPNQRVFNLTRSAFAGQQRYSVASWSGDVAATWEQFAEQIPAGLNFCMAGIPYWTTDIGGFFRDAKSCNGKYFKDQYESEEYKELLTRWFQYGAFTPVFRIHGYVSETEIWKYGSAFEKMAREFIDLRYQLMPYIYSEAHKVTEGDDILMKPLVYNYPQDSRVWNIKDQFLFGDNLVVCPVTSYKSRSRQVYLPKGKWYDFWTNEFIEGGQSIVAKAPLSKMPIYVKAGTILPFGPKIQYTTEKTNKPTELRIYPGADAAYVLYEDDMLSNDYKEGAYSEITIKYDETSGAVSLVSEKDNYSNYDANPKTFNIVNIKSGKSQKVSFKGDEISQD